MGASDLLPERESVSLDDKYIRDRGRVYMTGVQALVRLPMMQKQRDLAQGLNTAGFISGYRGSPLGGLDHTLWSAKMHLESDHIKFHPGINEDLAATAIWGSQQVSLNPANYDGVFALWYGKAPGVDRSMDAVRHANSAGTSEFGGVLLAVGDDHGATSSTLAGSSDTILAAAMVPVLYPSSVQEYLDFGLHGWAMSRFSGLWVALKCVSETVECAASVSVDSDRVKTNLPANFIPPPNGLHIRWPDSPLDQESRLINHKLPAAMEYARANNLDRVVIDAPDARLGIATCGKSYQDVRQAMGMLGIDDTAARLLGLRVYKIGMVWPLEPEGARNFAAGLDEILVIEEKRSLIEAQLKEALYNTPKEGRPYIVGKFDEQSQTGSSGGNRLLSAAGELTPLSVARVLINRLQRIHSEEIVAPYVAHLPFSGEDKRQVKGMLPRLPFYCSGCPHNISTKVPEGSRALGGIGCHAMATWMNRRTQTIVQMGGEGVPWIGEAPFTKTKHVFANLGDGTYFHSGLMAIRAAVAANVPITYKILFNDAVAMTGGQPVDGELTVPQVTRQLQAEGVKRIVVMTDDPKKYRGITDFASSTSIQHRNDLDRIQKELREYPQVSALIYDQTCATEKRRRRKRAIEPEPARQVVINDLVCEGCGDCSIKSNCLSVEPLETEFGRKRTINQDSCNKDFSCTTGFCPSFVTIVGARARKPAPIPTDEVSVKDIPLPRIPEVGEGFNIIVAGVGGSGVITLGALIGMASHMDGHGVSVMDTTGLAQKGGAATSHVRIAHNPEDIHATRVGAGAADLLLGGDILTSASDGILSSLARNRTRVLVNIAEVPTADFVNSPDWQFPVEGARKAILEALGDSSAQDDAFFIDVRNLVVPLMGDAIYTNPFMLGFAWQKGWIPLTLESLTRAIQLNRVAVEENLSSFLWGRRAAHDLPATIDLAQSQSAPSSASKISSSLDEIIAVRADYLTAYQNKAYADHYLNLVEHVRVAESNTTGTSTLTEAVARYYFKLLAYKDEYEVARLYTETSFLRDLNANFEPGYSLRFHLAPPTLFTPSPDKGDFVAKKTFGPWMLPLFRVLAKLRFLRGTAFDPFGKSKERRTERALIGEYERTMMDLIDGLNDQNLELITEIASVPEYIRGYGHVKDRHLITAREMKEKLLARLHQDIIVTEVQSAPRGARETIVSH
ncbi:indolepyruvate ferredoxin oxidoreductase family protein [Kineobactrum salinum]|uniref:Indolepyruvate ferredoxin oxidoreductase family protein n=1 Tax=Kineobactrum salinum TaxID=2708301 RepID=A0A6C0U426_9GAMM|nr:indolepyruvate ferredoxin oxidoreductase family protein [Kineobactrum salinum]QIB66892.1 indolepyruvate ferredoxin oxidoreductase family protein [Kineobactrum salinum]